MDLKTERLSTGILRLHVNVTFWLSAMHFCGYFTSPPRKYGPIFQAALIISIGLQFSFNIINFDVLVAGIPITKIYKFILTAIPFYLVPFIRALGPVILMYNKCDLGSLMKKFVADFAVYFAPCHVALIILTGCMLGIPLACFTAVNFRAIPAMAQNESSELFLFYHGLGSVFIVLWPLNFGFACRSLIILAKKHHPSKCLVQLLQDHAGLLRLSQQLNECFSWIAVVVFLEDVFYFVIAAQDLANTAVTGAMCDLLTVSIMILHASIMSAQLWTFVFLFEKVARLNIHSKLII
ncbi:uncharacterized protein LOC129586623 isoform X2 [Paramacrobiotus metropolitanus]|uniref:uncharacterized protein LOC129586623 isoform X2 n=1 Tax=Paramacrobiotus metropolitanus TaxID=2943436 RepID=UPI0024460138|nr:uncharacterized protein LOC129586623 isoform X2 [Paramacrobiotus metropolitanus]